ncbi:GAF domain-containing protein [Leptospira langatensis]|uniref:GAF domain-containing protein n=1 Tax=Leptospira langatensis TaxID=2484983 RepID=A0A5F1ZTC7_9LEPT|nr:adenylate/guanylate cyclase domain-containing protein [Leptospira langatensis]TGK00249.1 GAF domain-containing protein [Leptospira langatensis]TGL41117.1 GAF domain-containing protein [Leptospira langatensis]
MEKNESTKESNTFFEQEFKLLSDAQSFLNNSENGEDPKDKLKTLVDSYESLLKQSSKIMKIGDSTQHRLLKTQEELTNSNIMLEAAYMDLKLVTEVGRIITSSLEPKVIIQSVYQNTKSMVPMDILAFGIYDEEKKEIKYKFCVIDGRYTPAPSVDSLEEDNPSSYCIKHGQELISQDVEKDFPQYLAEIRKHFGENTQSASYFPLKVEERFIGVLTVHSYVKNAFQPNQLNILRTLANYVAIGVDNADAYRTLSKRNKELKDSLEKIEELNKNIEEERQKSENLLLNILPRSIADRLKGGEGVIADYFPSSTVLFADIVGFSKLTTKIKTPTRLVEILNRIFTEFDVIADKYKLEKIKTIGDCYMLAGGIPVPTADHADKAAEAALDMIRRLEELKPELEFDFNVRIGLHTGEVVAGVIGKNKFVYDLWGDSVNTASRMESHGSTGRIHVSEAVYLSLKDKYSFEDRSIIEVKGKGPMHTYFLLDKK